MLDASIFSRIKTKQDFDRERDEFEFRKRQMEMEEQLGGMKMQQMQQELSAPKMPYQGTGLETQLMNQKYMANLQSGMSEQEALQNATDTVLQSNVRIDPETGYEIRRGSIFGSSPSQVNNMPPSQVMNTPPSGLVGTPFIPTDAPMPVPTTPAPMGGGMVDPLEANQAAAAAQAQRMGQVDLPNAAPIDPSLLQGLSPRSREDLRKEELKSKIDLQRDITKLNYQDQLRAADDLLKSQEGRDKVGGVIARMRQINEELKERDAIVTTEQNLFNRIGTATETTPLGQAGRKVYDPQSQALALEYEKLQATLLPFFAKASGLGAKSLDSEGERKSIMGSFGDPAGIYETNVNQLNNLDKIFGIEQSNVAPMSLDPALLNYMTPEERALFQ